MSGIVGLISAGGAPVDAALLESMTAYMDFRGPDARRTWSDGPVGLGHTLLITTFEHARERQPGTLDGQVWISADARIDGRDVLRAELEAAGRVAVRDSTDCELILHAYHAWGEACLEHLIGDFAFAIWDGRSRSLFCARDHFGVKPFFYAQPRGEFVFSNTLKAVRLHPGLADTLNDQFVVDFLLFGFNQDVSTTAFVSIQRLAPAHSLTWRDGQVTIRRYWTLPIEDLVHYKRPEEYVERFLEVFKQAVGDRLRADSVGIFMSGGLDSTSVAAVAKTLLEETARNHRLQAYTAVHDQLVTDTERAWSTSAANHLHIQHECIALDEHQPYENFDRYATWFPEPIDSPFYVYESRLAQAAAGSHNVVLSGIGGDAVLYPSQNYLRNLIGSGRFSALGRAIAEYWRINHRLPPPYIRSWVYGMFPRRKATIAIPAWISPRLTDLAASRVGLADPPLPYNSRHPSHSEAVGLLKPGCWAYNLELSDPGFIAQRLEQRVPYFDLRLIRFVLHVPPVPWCVNKELLRSAMRGFLPEDVRLRPKSPWGGDASRTAALANGVREASRNRDWACIESYVNAKMFAQHASRLASDDNAVYTHSRPISLQMSLAHQQEALPCADFKDGTRDH